jgi:cell division septum initiation protein DivIVA
MSIREQEPPEFAHAFRGYERTEVDEYVTSMRDYTIQVEDRARAAESALVQCRRELASSPGTVGISERLAAILQLANEEAAEIRARARADSEATTEEATTRAERTIDEATRHRDAIQREIDELSAVREELLQRLIALGGQIVEATERYQGYPPGMSPLPRADVKLFDAEAVDDAPAVEAEPPTDPEADTQRIASTGQTPENP